jgi:hypothetical protein
MRSLVLRYSLSYRDLQELMAERMLSVDHTTVWRWVQRYAPMPPGFLWRRRSEVFFPITAELTVTFPQGGRPQIPNTASPVSARKTRLFVPIYRNFDNDAPLQATLDFNYQAFAEDIEIVERQFPEDLPIDLHAEAHFPADRSSIADRQGLAVLGLALCGEWHDGTGRSASKGTSQCSEEGTIAISGRRDRHLRASTVNRRGLVPHRGCGSPHLSAPRFWRRRQR